MIEEIIELSEKVRESNQGKDFLNYHHQELVLLDFTEFLSYNLKTYSDIYLNNLFLGGKDYLFNLKLSDWMILLKVLESNNESFTFLLTFFYKYLDIDLLDTYREKNELPSELEEYLALHSSNFAYSNIDEIPLKKFELTKSVFSDYKDRLIKEGASLTTIKNIQFETLDSSKLNDGKEGG